MENNNEFVVYKPHNESGSKNVCEYVIYPTLNGQKKTPGVVLVRPRETTIDEFYFVLETNKIEEIDRYHKGTSENKDLDFLLREYFRNNKLRSRAKEILLKKLVGTT
jgi:hypothetical protein